MKRHRTVSIVAVTLLAVFVVAASSYYPTWLVQRVSARVRTNPNVMLLPCASNPVVTTNADSNAGSLRDAITNACAGSTITFDMSQVTSPITLISGQLTIDKNLTIQGPTTTGLTIDGNHSSRVFIINSGVTATISNLTTSHGSMSLGGGIFNQGTLTLTGDTVRDSTTANGTDVSGASNGGNGGDGGGIYNNGALTIINSTISGNSTGRGGNASGSGNGGNGGNGAGIYNSGTLMMTNITVANNQTGAPGSASGGNDGSSGHGGGVFTSGGTVRLNNTIIANNTASLGGGFATEDDVNGAVDPSSSFNLVGAIDGMTGLDVSNSGNQVGTSDAPLNPLLGSLADNGGPTFTHLPQQFSPAIDAGSNALAVDQNNNALTTDQRGTGFPRVVHTTVDIGAVEAPFTPPPPSADIGVIKSTNSDTSLPDRDVVYTITVRNNGPDAASNATLNDTLPGTMTFVSLVKPNNNWSCMTPAGGSGGTVTCTNSSLAANVDQVFTLTGHIPPGTSDGTSFLNTATISTTTTDPTPENNSFDAEVTVIACVSDPVVTTNANSGPGSLRQAIADACDGSTITFDMTQVTSPITLTSSELVINKNLTITGPGADLLTVSGNQTTRVFDISNGSTATISGLTVANGKININVTTNQGGGIFNNGTLTINNSTVSGNQITGNGSNNFGGGIFNNGTLTINNSTVSGNQITGNSFNYGGGIFNEGTLTITNSTVSGNQVGSGHANIGGGIYNFNNGTLTITNSTISNNSASGSGGTGGGISKDANTVNTRNTIIAGNTAATDPDVKGAFNSQGHNLIGISGDSTGFGSNGDQVGSGSSPLDPKLDPNGLQPNGGPTKTISLQLGSPAVNAGDDCVAQSTHCNDNTITQLTTDQRGTGFPRLVGSHVDIGAVEVNYAITATAGTPQSAPITSAFTTQLKATVTESGMVKSGIAVTFTAPASGASGTFQGSSTSATVNTDATGIATAPIFTANGTAGSYNVIASFGTGQPTAIFALTNTQATTSTALTSSLNPSTLGQSVTFTATVTSAAGTPTGTVQFKDNGNNLGNPVALVSGVATFSTSALAVGTHTITAVYSGDSNFLTSTGTLSGGQVVNQASTTTTVTSSVNPSDFGQSVTFTATVTGPAGTVTPTGTVQFKDNGNNISTSQSLNASGVATVSTSTLSVGTHTITAVYSGDTNFLTSTGTLSGGQVVKPQPTLSINDVSLAEGNSGVTNFNFTGTLSAASNLTVTVNYATADGTATVANNDYQAASGTLTFAPGDTQKTVTVKVNGDTTTEPDETFLVNLTAPTNATLNKATGTGTILNDDGPAIQFSAPAYTVAEDAGRATITVNRLGDISQPASVNYATSDQSGLNNCSQITGLASQRCDYAITIGTLRFASGESTKNILVPIVDDAYVEGPEIFTLTLSNPSGGVLQGSTSATITITDNDVSGEPNPLDQDSFFIRQLYIDFLDREPDPAGLQGWLNRLNHCSIPTDCDRIAVTLGFVNSQEFTDRGGFIYRLYKTLPDASNVTFGRIPHYMEFITDMAKVSGFLSTSDLNAAKDAFIAEFMSRQEFKTKYDATLNSPASYVDSLLQVVNLPNHPTRNTWVNGLTNGSLTRGQVLRQLVESAEVFARFKNEAFVIMNYFGFLRRDADAQFTVWIQKLNDTNDQRLIINGFLNSSEFRQRFAP